MWTRHNSKAAPTLFSCGQRAYYSCGNSGENGFDSTGELDEHGVVAVCAVPDRLNRLITKRSGIKGKLRTMKLEQSFETMVINVLVNIIRLEGFQGLRW